MHFKGTWYVEFRKLISYYYIELLESISSNKRARRMFTNIAAKIDLLTHINGFYFQNLF